MKDDTRTTDEVMVSTSIRLPQSLIDKVRETAAVLGIAVTTFDTTVGNRKGDDPVIQR